MKTREGRRRNDWGGPAARAYLARLRAKLLSPRNLAIHRQFFAGVSGVELAALYGMSKQRVYQIAHAVERARKEDVAG